jgi:hypothetical protein
MTTETEKTNVSKGCAEEPHAGSCQFGVNDGGTTAICDTPTAQPCSAPVPVGMVYFIQAGDAVKIGYSTRVTKRLSSMQTGNHHGLVLIAEKPGTRAMERQYHQRFSRFRIKGEWFHAVVPVMKEASEISGVKYRSSLHLCGLPKIDPLEGLSPDSRKLHHDLDCKLRNEGEETRRMQLAIRMSMERDGATAAYKARQDMILGIKPRIRVRAFSQTKGASK